MAPELTMRMRRSAALTLLVSFAAFSQQAGPALQVDAGASQHAISADVYGISFYWNVGSGNAQQQAADLAAASDIRSTLRRWGGNNTSTYHWKYDVWNIDADWFFEVLPNKNDAASKLPDG